MGKYELTIKINIYVNLDTISAQLQSIFQTLLFAFVKIFM